jgi:anti-sigma regulatory factor (Ser/Thr protein kinase)
MIAANACRAPVRCRLLGDGAVPRCKGPIIQVLLPPDTDSPRRARRFVEDALCDGAPADVVELAVLLVSEVVTNAILHARSSVRVAITWDNQRLRVEVADKSAARPVARQFAPDSGTGRGLRLIEELSDAWGTQLVVDGKVVWFELAGA